MKHPASIWIITAIACILLTACRANKDVAETMPSGKVTIENDVEDGKQDKICDTQFPLTDFPWLKKIVEQYQSDTVVRITINICTYRDSLKGKAIEIIKKIPMKDFPEKTILYYYLYNCEGQCVCSGKVDFNKGVYHPLSPYLKCCNIRTNKICIYKNY